MPLELLGHQSKSATLMFVLPRPWAAPNAASVETRIEIEECRTKRKVSIWQPDQEFGALHLGDFQWTPQ